ncbi:hypothetical protein Psuf_014420 [Phytohabitans suffuscus]|uniref:Major facilitator superfamily (MFS) profile domain-containing protein n=1 Tax=Phytohabitans suffuscus TaxID=624315 RepID=A0A6F8YDN4_9ACTN|nr:MFS transporter [Phytohabitans suffuscus]BCB84129.1 hypothetical protein Psuf_014420 [Phytohabitans suffuscus]
MTAGVGLPTALAEPTVPVRRSWIALVFSANLGVWMAFFTPIQVLLPNQVELIDPANKEAMFGWVTALGALAAVIANPLAGALSDRTSLRIGERAYGRRHVWTLSSALLGAASLAVLGQQRTIVGVAVCWVAAQVCFNAALATLTAAIPDRVPVAQRGGVSGWVGIPQSLGLVVGAVLVTAIFTENKAGYYAVAVAVLILALPFALFTPDDPLPPAHRTREPLLSGMWISPGGTRTSPGPGAPASWCRSATRWARSTCSTSCRTGWGTTIPRAACSSSSSSTPPA